ncbi:MAG: right-handed parallel beta-helix repeat-containing protein, partial [Thermoplasmata archaeon]|nr:right-handed parallel beta-helix repeat-containing protein [Thermoplasmata archaeon]
KSYIGTDKYGREALPNKIGVHILGGASDNKIGSTEEGEGNIISGNTESGVKIEGTGTEGNIVFKSYIGTDKDGREALPNKIGVHILGGASDNTIGGEEEGEGTIISGNTETGVLIEGKGTNKNSILWNYIGTDESCREPLPNGNGVRIENGASQNYLEDNVISGNNKNGVFISGEGTLDNKIHCNFIGTDRSKTKDLGNKENGVCIANLGICSNTVKIRFNQIRWNQENGIGIWCSNHNYIGSNTLWYNCRGIRMVESNSSCHSNDIKYCTCTSTGIHFDHSGGEFIGNTITDDEGDGIHCVNGSNPVIHYNNIYNNSGFDILNDDDSVTIDAKYNWWGGADAKINGKVDVSNPLTVESTGSDAGIMNGTNITGFFNESLVVEYLVKDLTSLSSVQFAESPFGALEEDIGNFVVLMVNETGNVNELTIKMFYKESDIPGIDENSLKMFWWDGEKWQKCSDTGVNTNDTGSYVGYIWAKVRTDTTPSLSDMVGTPFGAAEVKDTGSEVEGDDDDDGVSAALVVGGVIALVVVLLLVLVKLGIVPVGGRKGKKKDRPEFLPEEKGPEIREEPEEPEKEKEIEKEKGIEEKAEEKKPETKDEPEKDETGIPEQPEAGESPVEDEGSNIKETTREVDRS